MSTGDRPGPFELWQQAGGDGDRFRELLAGCGHLLSPGDEGYEQGVTSAPCGWRAGPGDGRAGRSPAAADVAHVLERLAARHPRASAPGLVLLLARRYCPAMLRRKWRP